MSDFAEVKLAYIDEWGEFGKQPKQVVRNIVQNIDGTLSALPPELRTDKDGWWLNDGQVYWKPPTQSSKRVGGK